MALPWPPTKETLERDRAKAFEEWGERTRWVENWFSNFLPYKQPLVHKGLEYHCAETFYQAMKSQEPGYREAISKVSPSKSKFLARKAIIRPDWDQIKVSVMNRAQMHKINTDPEFRERLAETIGRYIYEFNNWDDKFWGCSIYDGRGENVLGRILMNLRAINFEDEIPF